MKSKASTIILVLFLIAGLSLLLYPTFANWWNGRFASRMVASYTGEVANLNQEEYDRVLEAAREYNKRLATKNTLSMSELELADYRSQLDVASTGVMGYVSIDKINCTLPIYHGTDEAILQVAIGHLDWSSLPVGGESSHCVISGHRGLPSMRLFTDIDQLRIGDTFTLNVLDENFYYEVDQILTVLPEQTEDLRIVPGHDYCTLVTCTPYGVNSHRLLVRGHRIEGLTSPIRVTADAAQEDELVVALFISFPILLLLFIVLMLTTGKPKVDIKKYMDVDMDGNLL